MDGIPVVSDVSLAEVAGVVAGKQKNIVLLDVREDHEVARAAIAGAIHIPLMEIPDRVQELPKDKMIYVFCHHGGRSRQACHFLLPMGFQCKNMAGGIHRYALEIDSSIPLYE